MVVAASIALIAPSEIALRRSDRTNLHKEEGCAAEGERGKGQKRGIERNEINDEPGGPTERKKTTYHMAGRMGARSREGNWTPKDGRTGEQAGHTNEGSVDQTS